MNEWWRRKQNEFHPSARIDRRRRIFVTFCAQFWLIYILIIIGCHSGWNILFFVFRVFFCLKWQKSLFNLKKFQLKDNNNNKILFIHPKLTLNQPFLKIIIYKIPKNNNKKRFCCFSKWCFCFCCCYFRSYLRCLISILDVCFAFLSFRIIIIVVVIQCSVIVFFFCKKQP